MSNTATENDYLSIGGGVNLFDDEARFILKNRNKLQEFKDLDFRFGRNPNTNDVVLSTGDNAVKQAIRNILLTQYYERPFRPGIGAGIRSLLFEQQDEITARQLEDAITEAIENHEPRARLIDVNVELNGDHGYKATIVFGIRNRNTPVTFTTFLEAPREI